MSINVIIPIGELACQVCDKLVEYIVFEEDWDYNEVPNGYCKEHAIMTLRNDIKSHVEKSKYSYYNYADWQLEAFEKKSKLADDELLVEQRHVDDYL